MKQSELLKEICDVTKRREYLQAKAVHWTTLQTPNAKPKQMLLESKNLSKYLKVLASYRLSK